LEQVNRQTGEDTCDHAVDRSPEPMFFWDGVL
jgi:hypothetical protein